MQAALKAFLNVFLPPRFRIAPLAFAVLAVGQVVSHATGVRVEAADRPNIVLILADDLGINDLGCYGRAEYSTPHLDRLAARGVRFTAAYNAQPICSASRAAIMTGKSPARLHLTTYLPGRPDCPSQKLLQPVIEGQLPLEERTVAELLRESGYATGLIGKWHLGNGPFGAKGQGFDVVVTPSADTPPSDTEGGKGEFAITSAAVQFINDNKERPFFCYVSHNNPHIPLGAQPELVKRLSHTFNPMYAAMIATLDESVGRLVTAVESAGLTDRTLFVFASDNGGLHVPEGRDPPPTHNTPYRAGKGYLYEGGIRTPLIVAGAGVSITGAVAAPVQLTDLTPTFLAAAGITAATTVGPLDGVNIQPLLQGKETSARPLFWHFPHYTNQGSRPAGAILDGQWKLIEHFEDGGLELFNLTDDPGEQHNLAETDKDRAEAMRVQLEAWRVRVGAQRNEPNPEFKSEEHRKLYVDVDASRLQPLAGSTETGAKWKAWRAAIDAATRGRSPRLTPGSGDIRLLARNARVHATTMRYEPEPHKDVLGYWTDVNDWADWEFDVPQAGRFEVEIQQGCGTGSGGANVDLIVSGQTLSFVVQETGHFQHMILVPLGVVNLPAGGTTLEIRSRSKPGVAVMDVRRVVLRPAPPNSPAQP